MKNALCILGLHNWEHSEDSRICSRCGMKHFFAPEINGGRWRKQLPNGKSEMVKAERIPAILIIILLLAIGAAIFYGFRAQEVGGEQYQTLVKVKQDYPQLGKLISSKLKDGKISEPEFEEIQKTVGIEAKKTLEK